MPIINEKGQICIFKFKVNIIDFLVWVFILCLILGGYLGWDAYHKPHKPDPILNAYSKTIPCPICAKPRVINIDKGTLPPEEHKKICDRCGNEVYYIPSPPILEITPAINWSQAYDEYLLKQADPEHYKLLLEQGKP